MRNAEDLVGVKLYYVKDGSIIEDTVKSHNKMLVFNDGTKRNASNAFHYKSQAVEYIVQNYKKMIEYTHAFGSLTNMRITLNDIYDEFPESFI